MNIIPYKNERLYTAPKSIAFKELSDEGISSYSK